ncbi:unnamed protein product, partial [Rotaria sordida]
ISLMDSFLLRLGFLLFDTDRNDEIDFVEFLMANAFATSKTRHEALSYVFDMCDYTQDGRMDMNELVRFSSVATKTSNKCELKLFRFDLKFYEIFSSAFSIGVIYLFESDSIDRISSDTNTSDVFIIKTWQMFK